MTNDFSYEIQYAGLVDQILSYGFKQKNERTGIVTKRRPHGIFKVNEHIYTSAPILLGKQVMWKSAIEEILWIMQKGSNNINDLRPHIWDEWADPDGSIGKAYGYQISQYKQVERCLDRLKKDPSDRRAVINLWNPADLDQMNLVPCCFASVWTIVDGRLYGMLTQRSADMMLGVPFNTFQYYALLLMFAKHLNVKAGGLLHTMADAHIYETHFEGAREYVNRIAIMQALFDNYGNRTDAIFNLNYCENLRRSTTNIFGLSVYSEQEFDDLKTLVRNYLEVNPNLNIPELRLETDKTDFWEFTIDDFVLENYHPMPHIKFDVAV